jgi:hypothetical protein
MMQKTRGKQNALPAPGLKNMPYEVTARYTAKLTCCTKMLDPTTEAKRGNWTTWVPHGTMGLKCVNVPRIMRVGAPSFRSIYLTISTLVIGQETKGVLKAGPATHPFGGKVY